MSHAAPDPDQPAPAAEALDPAVLRAEERLAMLRELAEIGMRLARALERRVLAEDEAAENEAAEPAAGEAKGRDPADAFSRLSRAIRLTLSLEARTDEALRALKAGVEQERLEAAERAGGAAAEKRRGRLARVHGLVMRAARADLRDDDDWERLDTELDDRLDEDEAFWNDPERPLRDIVERFCRYFSLTPDWSRWDGEGWTEDDPPPWPWAAAEARPADSTSPPTRNGAPALAAARALE